MNRLVRAPSALRQIASLRCRALSSERPQPEFDLEMAVDFAETHLSLLKNPFMAYSRTLLAIKTEMTGQPLLDRWQSVVQVFLTSQVHSVVHYGFTPNDDGLKAFMTSYESAKRSDTSGIIKERSSQAWDVVTDTAFDFTLDPKSMISLDQARQMTHLLSSRMQTEEFLSSAEAAVVRLTVLDMQPMLTICPEQGWR